MIQVQMETASVICLQKRSSRTRVKFHQSRRVKKRRSEAADGWSIKTLFWRSNVYLPVSRLRERWESTNGSKLSGQNQMFAAHLMDAFLLLCFFQYYYWCWLVFPSRTITYGTQTASFAADVNPAKIFYILSGVSIRLYRGLCWLLFCC